MSRAAAAAITLLALTGCRNFRMLDLVDRFTGDWYKKHVCYGIEGALGFHGKNRLEKADRVVLFAPDFTPQIIKIDAIYETAVYRQKANQVSYEMMMANASLRDEIGFYWNFRGNTEPRYLARFSLGADIPPMLSIAVRGLSKGAIAVGGRPEPITQRPDDVPADALYLGARYATVDNHTVIEEYIGSPVHSTSGGGFHSVRLRHRVRVNTRTLEDLETVLITAYRENPNLPTPTLDWSNWWKTGAETAGFVSRDKGRTWQILTITKKDMTARFDVRDLGQIEKTEFTATHQFSPGARGLVYR